MDLIADSLDFNTKVGAKKEEVGQYFVTLGKKLETASNDLEEVAKKTETGDDKSDLSKNLIREAVEAAKATFKTLKTHLDNLGIVGDDKVVGWAVNSQEGTKPSENELKKAYNSLKGIVEEADKVGIKKSEVGNTTLNPSGGADNKEGAKILSTASGHKPGAGDAGKAAAIVSTVSGEEILAAIVVSGETDAELSGDATAKTTPMSFARGNGTGSH